LAESLKRHFMREKEAKQLLSQVQQKTKIDIGKLIGTHIEFAETETATIFLIDGKPLFARKDGNLFPTLGFEDIVKFLPQVVVNMGAVPHVCNGADVMAPGVVAVDGTFEKDSFVVVLDEQHKKPLAIGTALYDSETTRSLKQGKIVLNVHFVGDKLWHLLRKL
jgi:PUA-domain protein